MSFLTDALKSVVDTVAGKAGIDPSIAEGLVDKVVPGALTDEEAAVAAEGVEPGAEAEAGGGLMDQAKSLLDRDGDGNPLNDIAGMAAGFLNKDTPPA